MHRPVGHQRTFYNVWKEKKNPILINVFRLNLAKYILFNWLGGSTSICSRRTDMIFKVILNADSPSDRLIDCN